MLGKNTLIVATALVASMALAACDSNNLAGLPPAEEDPPVIGVFGLEVGVPVSIMTTTRGANYNAVPDGPSVDTVFTVTFNNVAGTDVTITTPEGEVINFTEADLEWLGVDALLSETARGDGDGPWGPEEIELAKLTSSRGDRLDVVLGTLSAALYGCETEGCEEDQVPVVAVARLDEVDTRFGFETYGVVGQLTNTSALPRYALEDEELDGEECIGQCEGTLIEGTAYYDGGFLASIYRDGELLSDSIAGDVDVGINFADGSVDLDLYGQYRYDDVDDLQCVFCDEHSGEEDYNLDNWYIVHLSGSGSGDDIDFDVGVTYSGVLEGFVEVSDDAEIGVEDVDLAGVFGGAVYGPGADGTDVGNGLGSEDDIVDATMTAGVFEADGVGEDVGEIEIVGGFTAESEGCFGGC